MTTRIRNGFAYFILVLILCSCKRQPAEYNTIEGAWRCEEYSLVSDNRIFLVEIDRSNIDQAQYLISNFHNVDINDFVHASLKGDVVTIPDQVFSSILVWKGTGKVSSDFRRIDFVYNISDLGSQYEVHAKFTRPD